MGSLRRGRFRAFKCRMGVHRFEWWTGTHVQLYPAKETWPIRQQVCVDCRARGERERIHG
jgi:hypothetical protein